MIEFHKSQWALEIDRSMSATLIDSSEDMLNKAKEHLQNIHSRNNRPLINSVPVVSWN